MENNNVVNEDLTNSQPSEGENQIRPGDKTPPNELLSSLQEEREKRREAEQRARQLEEELQAFNNNSTFSNDEDDLKKELLSLKSEISEIKDNNLKREIQQTYPLLKEKWEDFQEFTQKSENKGIGLNNLAKLFLAENGVYQPKRKGLENSTGGDKIVPAKQGMTADEIKVLRETNYKQYLKLLKEGKIKISS